MDPRKLLFLGVIGLLGCPGSSGDDDDDGDDDLADCPRVDIVFAMDTSGSMDDDAQALCSFIGGLEGELADRGLETFRVTALGLFETSEFSDTGSPLGEAYSCLEDTVYRALGGDGVEPLEVPGDPPDDVVVDGDLFTPGLFDPRGPESNEYWGSATALLAAQWD